VKASYAPTETWPEHQKAYWNEALAEARRAGWSLTYIDAPHKFGVVSCPQREHTFLVDKTANGGETKSKEARKRIRACRHGSVLGGSKVQARQDECKHLLDSADQLICDAEDRLARAETRQDAWADLELLEIQLQTAELTVKEALSAEEEAAWEAVLDADDAPDPPEIAAALDDAAAVVAQGEEVANVLGRGRPGLARPLLRRASKAKSRIVELRDRLRLLEERSKPEHD
jgi:hypothetical protein